MRRVKGFLNTQIKIEEIDERLNDVVNEDEDITKLNTKLKTVLKSVFNIEVEIRLDFFSYALNVTLVLYSKYFRIILEHILTSQSENKTTLVIYKDTLKDLKHLARKDQSYDDLIKDLIKMKLKEIPAT